MFFLKMVYCVNILGFSILIKFLILLYLKWIRGERRCDMQSIYTLQNNTMLYNNN